MYKLLLCWRYLRTRYIALASIVSVTLGVATLIVVNAVMAGFSNEMHDRIKGVNSDLSLDGRGLNGFENPQWHMEQIENIAGEHIKSMTAVAYVPAILNYKVASGQWMTQQVTVVGIDAEKQSSASKFAEYLQHPDNREKFEFILREEGYDLRDRHGGDEAPLRVGMDMAGWKLRRERAQLEKEWKEFEEAQNLRNNPPLFDPDRPLSVEEAAAQQREIARLVDEAPEELAELLNVAREAIFDENFPLAVALYEKAIGLKEDDPLIHAELSMCFAQMEQFDKAVTAILTAASLAPDEAAYVNDLAAMLVLNKQYDEAWEKLSAQQEEALAHFNMALLLNQAGQPLMARDHLDSAEAAGMIVPEGALGSAPQPTAEDDDFHDPFGRGNQLSYIFDPAVEQHDGCVLGMALVSFRPPKEDMDAAGEEHFMVLPGDDIRLTFPNAGTPPEGINATFTVIDLYESKMHEFDKEFVFVPLEKLQDLRGLINPENGARFVNSIQIRLHDPDDADMVRDKLRAAFEPTVYQIGTWRDKQGALLAAVNMETVILNVLLFLIIAVAGFGILAIFFMIVVEKTKDIGILKSLGAHASGVMGIFLAYGLSLGIVGAGVGLVAGLLFVFNINEIADWLGRITGQPVFDPQVYYFYEIPTQIETLTVAWIVFGAMLIAVAASVFPALRAARLKPVEALRYE